jgi:hypothetical protein
LHEDAPREILLGVGCDWWFEARINGKVVYSTMDCGNGPFSIHFTNHGVRGTLQAGDNQIVLLLRRGGGSSWQFSAAELPLLPHELDADAFERLYLRSAKRIVCGPYLQAKPDGRLAACVHLNVPLLASLQLRINGGEWSEEIWEEPVAWEKPVARFHSIMLPEVPAANSVEYRIITRDFFWQNEEISPVCTVPVLASSGEHSLFITSDLQVTQQRRQEMMREFCANCNAGEAGLFCSLGDIGSLFHDFKKEYFECMLSPFLASCGSSPIWIPGRGNHEGRGPDTGAWAKYIGATFYDFYYGDTAYLVLDSGEDKRVPDKDWHFYTRRIEFTALFQAQRKWLNKVVNSPRFRNAKRRVILCHSTPFEINADFEEFHEQFMARNLRSLLGDYFYSPNPPFKIDLWISGHTHKSCRFTPGKDEFAAYPESPFKYRLCPGEVGRYPFPVLILDGPGPHAPSGALVKFSRDNIEVTARHSDGALIDHFRINHDGTITVLESALKTVD